MSIVVSDTSPIRALNHLGLISMLASLYGSVYLPDAVAAELRRPGRLFSAFEPDAFSFFHIESPVNQRLVQDLEAKLDAGEAAALVLAMEKSADRILIDERDARIIAHEMGLHVVGVLGVLLEAKQQGLIPEVRPLINRLQSEINFHVSPQLVADVLRLALE